MPLDPVHVSQAANGVRFGLRVLPRASRTEIAGSRDGRLVVRVTAPPVDRAANDATAAVLARALRVPARMVTIVGGETARNKTVQVAGLTLTDLRSRLDALLTT